MRNIVVEEGSDTKLMLVDQSMNGVYINGQRIFQKWLMPGDRFSHWAHSLRVGE